MPKKATKKATKKAPVRARAPRIVMVPVQTGGRRGQKGGSFLGDLGDTFNMGLRGGMQTGMQMLPFAFL